MENTDKDKTLETQEEVVEIDYSDLFKKRKQPEGMQGGRVPPDRKPGRDMGR